MVIIVIIIIYDDDDDDILGGSTAVVTAWGFSLQTRLDTPPGRTANIILIVVIIMTIMKIIITVEINPTSFTLMAPQCFIISMTGHFDHNKGPALTSRPLGTQTSGFFLI